MRTPSVFLLLMVLATGCSQPSAKRSDHTAGSVRFIDIETESLVDTAREAILRRRPNLDKNDVAFRTLTFTTSLLRTNEVQCSFRFPTKNGEQQRGSVFLDTAGNLHRLVGRGIHSRRSESFPQIRQETIASVDTNSLMQIANREIARRFPNIGISDMSFGLCKYVSHVANGQWIVIWLDLAVQDPMIVDGKQVEIMRKYVIVFLSPEGKVLDVLGPGYDYRSDGRKHLAHGLERLKEWYLKEMP